MSRTELLIRLRQLAENSEAPTAQVHMQAVNALLAWIDDEEIAEAYLAVRRYYA